MNSSHVWNYYAEKSSSASKAYKDGSYWPRGKMLGGCSSNNIMLYVRGNSRDYDRWEEQGNPGWDWKSVLEYFKKSEDNGAQHLIQEKGEYHSTGGLLKVNSFMSTEMTKLVITEAAFELGILEIMDINSDEHIGYNVAQGTVHKGKRWSTAKAFLNSAKERPNLHIVKNAHVTKINFEGTTATGVTFDLPDNEGLKVVAKKEVVLSAGAVNSPQILQLSGVGAKEELERLNIPLVKDIPSVGENLQDHVIVPLFLSLHGSRPIEQHMDELVDSIYSYVRYGLGPFGSISVTDLLGFVNTVSPTAKFPDIQYHHMLILWKTPNIEKLTQTYGWNDNIADQIIKQNQKSEILVVLVTLLNPKSKGSIKLRTANPYDAPVINANYLDDERDVKTIIRGIRHFRKLLPTENFTYHELKDFHLEIEECDRQEYDSDSYWECYARYMSTTIYHPTSTAKMGPDGDAAAVVDPRLKVRGVQNLRVIDASIMPDIVSGNTNAPTIMIGEKGSDLIKEDHAEPFASARQVLHILIGGRLRTHTPTRHPSIMQRKVRLEHFQRGAGNESIAYRMAVAFAKLVPLLAGAALKATPAAASITAAVGAAISAATAVVGVGKLAIVPILIASLAYYNYDLFDPENRPFNVPEVDREYDFIVVGAGSAGAVVASRLSEIGGWKVLLLEAGGHETEISDVPILSLYLHKSKLDWKYSRRTTSPLHVTDALSQLHEGNEMQYELWRNNTPGTDALFISTIQTAYGRSRGFVQAGAFGVSFFFGDTAVNGRAYTAERERYLTDLEPSVRLSINEWKTTCNCANTMCMRTTAWSADATTRCKDFSPAESAK
ncbi:hypothetical protein ZHAS_00009927 [Anopheles sinensis]|uniref:GMC_OxRdtase_N domain-containing protein n=1 Tax=Anopheles sinensis TaxID=74873 RepID=A0A084VW88_ANOSI|nr:hypothetical protein ZHAS_00009927 [Anopheles sinensis]